MIGVEPEGLLLEFRLSGVWRRDRSRGHEGLTKSCLLNFLFHLFILFARVGEDFSYALHVLCFDLHGLATIASSEEAGLFFFGKLGIFLLEMLFGD